MPLNPDPEISRFEIDGFRFVVIDKVLKDPDAMRNYAIEMTQRGAPPKPIATGYELHPRRQIFINRFPGLLRGLISLAHETMGDNILSFYDMDAGAEDLRIKKGPVFNCTYQFPFNPPHVDADHISSFIYLNSPDQCSGGTGVYRHKPSGQMHVRQRKVDLRWMEEDALEEPLNYSAGEWELLHKFDMRYNRLVLFNACVIHKIFIEPGEMPFGEDIASTRLTLNNFFLYQPPGAPRMRDQPQR